MKCHRNRKPATQMSLFPFLAVLVCTMGVLIVLLVTLVQQARVDAEAARAQSTPSDAIDPVKEAAEDARWLQEQLEHERQFVKEKIDEQEAALAHLESHLREIEDRARQLEERQRALQALAEGKKADLEKLRAQQQGLAQLLDEARRKRDALREGIRRRKPSFAVIPYLGPRGTHRRPVYIECTEEGLTIQPEGVRITAEDFGGLVGPGNPLDAALRTIREFYRRAGLRTSPYPLLIVRPSGTYSYALARAAMRSWDDEFGYELIDEEMDLTYPPQSTALAAELRRTVQLARSRQKALASAMPAAYGSRDGSVAYVASRRGGFVATGGEDQQVNRVGGFGQGADARYRDGGPGRGSRATQPIPEGSAARPGRPQSGHQTHGNPRSQGGSHGGQAARRGGSHWGLPQPPQAGAVGITRPIRLSLYADRLTIEPERGNKEAQPITVPLYGPVTGHVDAILSAIWRVMDSWGLAVVGGYWQPILKVEVAPGAERRYLELERAFRNSGLIMQRVNP